MPFKNQHPLYATWQSMKRRCDNPNMKQYADYGGRGIAVCERWLHSFPNFLEDMGPRPAGHSLDRKDNDLGYTPENCRWASRKEQQRNQRVTLKVTIDGVEYSAADLADRCGLKTLTIVERAKLGLSLAEVLDPKRRVGGDWRAAVAKRVANQRAATHCPRGHAWDAANTRITPEGWKNCRACHRDKMRRRNAASRIQA